MTAQKFVVPAQKQSTDIAEQEALFGNGQSYLPRISLMYGLSKLVSDGKMPPDKYAFEQGDTLKNLGSSFAALVIACRYAARWSNEDDEFCQIITQQPAKRQTFLDVIAKADAEKAAREDSTCSYGPDYLLWLPEIGKFATFGLFSPSARNQKEGFRAGLPDGQTTVSMTVGTKPITTKGKKPRTYLVPICFESNVPVTNFPTEEAYTAAIAQFLQERDDSEEKAEEPATDRET